MKNIFLPLVAPFILLSSICAQNTGIGTITPDASAMLDITSNNQGLLIPRFNTGAITSISNPAKGLLVLDTTTNQLMMNMGTPASPNWQTIVFKSGWNLAGNSNTNPVTDFIGTTDAQPLQFRVNNLSAGQVHPVLNNTALGYSALSSNTSGTNNTANGANALYSNNTGHDNIGTGFYALYSNTTGSGNTASGNFVLFSNSTGSNNTANGDYALFANTTGSNNSAHGFQSLGYNSIGSGNTASGLASMYSNTTGSSNTGTGNYALYSSTTGSGNTATGNYALYTNTSGNNNTVIGANADISSGGLNDATAIGANAISNANDKVVIGGPYAGTIVIGGYANWSNFSDGRFKENVREDVPGLSFISKLRPVTYQVNNKSLLDHITHLMRDSLASRFKKTNAEYAAMQEKRSTGFIAQEVEKTAKEIGYDFDGVNAPRNETDHYSLSYASFVVPLVKAVQEQQEIIGQQNKKIEMLEKRLAALESRTGRQ